MLRHASIIGACSLAFAARCLAAWVVRQSGVMLVDPFQGRLLARLSKCAGWYPGSTHWCAFSEMNIVSHSMCIKSIVRLAGRTTAHSASPPPQKTNESGAHDIQDSPPAPTHNPTNANSDQRLPKQTNSLAQRYRRQKGIHKTTPQPAPHTLT